MNKIFYQSFFLLIGAASLWGGMPKSSGSEGMDLYRVPAHQEMKLEGVVVERSNQELLVRREDGSQVLVSWSNATQIKEKKSNFLRGAKRYSSGDLLLGLSLLVEGHGDNAGRLVARKIKFTQDDLEVARSISTSLEPVERQLDEANRQISQVERRLQANESRTEQMKEQLSGQLEDMGEGLKKTRSELNQTQRSVDLALTGVEEANQRITSLDDYEEARSLTVLFKAGSFALSDEAILRLKEFADSVQTESGYLIEVTGHASSDGNEEYNRRLSENRADSVRKFLAETGGVSLRRFISPYGFGESKPIADDATRDGRRLNRRVEIRLLLNRGLTKDSERTARSGSN